MIKTYTKARSSDSNTSVGSSTAGSRGLSKGGSSKGQKSSGGERELHSSNECERSERIEEKGRERRKDFVFEYK